MAACLYQETRLNLDPAFSTSTVDILLPAHSASAFAARISPKRRRLNAPAINYDEATFQKTHLASEGSIHFRSVDDNAKKTPSPRAILWRVLEERSVLELQAVDLWQDDIQATEPLLTLRVNFPSQIRPHGVCFAEKRADVTTPSAVAFVLTTSGELFTLDLRREIFTKPDATTDGPQTWCTRSSPAPLSNRNPFKLFATSADDLWASLSDGSLVRLERKQGIDGAKWRETYYAEGGWKASMRGLIAWKGSVTARYGDIELQPGTATSLVASPDGKHMWTTCLDHTLKAWEIGTGKLVLNIDLVGDPSRDLQKPVDHLLDPQQSQLLRIVPSRVPGEYVVVTYSPFSRQFKFWDIRDLDAQAHGIQDLRQDMKLAPPIEDLTETAVWSLETFHPRAPRSAGEAWRIWLFVRCGAKCSTFKLDYNLDDHASNLSHAWKNNWTAVDSGLNTVEELKKNVDAPVEFDANAENVDIVDKWCDFMFRPGRFTAPTLETALTVFWSSLGRGPQATHSSITNSTRPMKERVCEAVGVSVELTHSSDGTPLYERYTQDIVAQWRTFYGVVRDLHKRRSDPLTLTYDVQLDAPWLVMSDQIAPVKALSECEVLWHNRSSLHDLEEQQSNSILVQSLADPRNAALGQLFYAVDVLRASLPSSFIQSFSSFVKQESLQNLDNADGQDDGIYDVQAIYDKSGFLGQVSDDDYNLLTDALEPLGGLGSLDSDIFLGVLDFLEEARQGSPQNRQLTRYGARALIRGAQETLELGLNILLDLMLLTVFIGAELEEDTVPADFDASAVMMALMNKAKEYWLLNWLASSVRQESSQETDETKESKELVRANHIQSTASTAQALTVFESMFLGDWASMETPNAIAVSQPLLLSYWSRAWTFGMRLSKQYAQVTTHVMATLIKHGDLSLATQFQKFLPESPWAYYLQARLQLALGEHQQASLLFEAAGHTLATGRYFDADQNDSANLLDLDEREHFNDGLARYYRHVVALFDKVRAMSYVAEFADLGMQACQEDGIEDHALENDLLSRQFAACLHTSRFTAACSVLNDLTDMTLRKSMTNQLLKAIIDSNNAQTLRHLLTLPFPSPADVDEYLNALASKATPLSVSPFASTGTSKPSISLLDMSGPSSSKPTPSTPPHKLLYAYRIYQNDLRGAATCLWERLQLLLFARDHPSQSRPPKSSKSTALVRKSSTFTVPTSDDDDSDDDIDEPSNALDEDISNTYLILINVFTLMSADDAWLLSRPLPPPPKPIVPGKLGVNRGQQLPVDGEGKKDVTIKRQVITLSDVRKRWQQELDMRADLRAGRFAAFDLGWDGAVENGDGEAANGMNGSHGARGIEVLV